MIQSWRFGTGADGQVITAFQLTSDSGFQAVILNEGAILQSFHLPTGRNVTLGFETWAGYENDITYMGRIIGPNANRISEAQFKIDEDVFQLPANDGQHNLHSGPNGMHRQIWDVERSNGGLTMDLHFPDEQNPLPGTVNARLNITLVQNTLRVEMRATTNRPAPMNLTWHPYWNLGDSPKIDGHNLRIEADGHTLLKGGAAVPVKDTRYDFRRAHPLGSVRLDTNYDAVRSARLVSGKTAMSVISSLPDMQVYTGDALGRPRAGIALEPQYRPNDINLARNSLLRPGEIFSHWIEYRFDGI